MRLATVQFAPLVGEVTQNIEKADKLINDAENEGRMAGIELLVLPELAFSGYNHPSLSAIKPYLEPTASGISTRWAKQTAARLQCIVALGYPEYTVPDPQTVQDSNHSLEESSGRASATLPPASSVTDFTPSYYNSLIFVSSAGEVLAHYRKTFLYYTDETWASENTEGFFSGHLPLTKPTTSSPAQHEDLLNANKGSDKTTVAAGICMDVNPYKFTAPWTAYEFANHCLKVKAKLVVLSMAWLTRLSGEDIETQKENPDLNTVGYWVERFSPLLRPTTPPRESPEKTNGKPVNGVARDSTEEEEIIVIFANRTGFEGTAPLIGEVRYAGSSCVMGMRRPLTAAETGEVRIWDILGRGTEEVLVVDTEMTPRYGLKTKNPAGSSDDED